MFLKKESCTVRKLVQLWCNSCLTIALTSYKAEILPKESFLVQYLFIRSEKNKI